MCKFSLINFNSVVSISNYCISGKLCTYGNKICEKERTNETNSNPGDDLNKLEESKSLDEVRLYIPNSINISYLHI